MRVATLAFLLAACGAEPDFYAFRSQHTGGPNDGTTVVVVWVSDSPADGLDRVLVHVDRVELVGPNGAVALATARQPLDLLELRNGRRARVAQTSVAPGVYDRLRLRLAPDALVERDGQAHALQVDQAVVELDGPFLLGGGERLELQADFNVRRSVLERGGTWRLAPDLALFDAAADAAIAGSVSDPAGGPVAGATVSAQAGVDEVLSTRTDPDGTFRLGPLAAGIYTLVVTAPGRAPVVEHGVQVTDGVSAGHAFVLQAATPGQVVGDGPAGANLTARLYRNGSLIAWTAVDAATGAFGFTGVAPGAYDVQLWNAQGPVAAQAVVVGAGSPAQVVLR